MYNREDLRIMSITGKPTRNTNYGQEKSVRIPADKLQYIKGDFFGFSPFCGNVKYSPFHLDKFHERVQNEQISAFEVEKRCSNVRVHKMINEKIQNLKRYRQSDCQKYR